MSKKNNESPLNDIQIGAVTAHWAKSNNLKTNYYDQVDSTNTQARLAAFSNEEANNELVVYFAEEQTNGRGRFERTWTSPQPGSALLSTWSFLIQEAPHPHTTAKIGMALFNAMKSTWQSLPLSLKAPNDLYLGSKKIGGLLVETITQGTEHRLLIGLGLNVLAHPEDVITSTSLISHLPKNTPLLGEDWILFVDRFLFELTLLVPNSFEELNSTQKQNYIELLNLNPNLDKKYKTFNEVKFE